MTTVNYPIPYAEDPEVRAMAVRLWHNSRAPLSAGGGDKSGLDSLLHAEQVALRLMHTYVLMGNEGGNEYARLYGRVASMFSALGYASGTAQSTLKYREFLKNATGRAA